MSVVGPAWSEGPDLLALARAARDLADLVAQVPGAGPGAELLLRQAGDVLEASGIRSPQKLEPGGTHHREHYYGGSWSWDLQWRVPTVRSFLAELIGAGIAGAQAGDATDLRWWGGGAHRGFDVLAAGRRIDVKRAWDAGHGMIGFGGPGRSGAFDEAAVDDILLILLDDDQVEFAHDYGHDGTVTIAARLRPQAAILLTARQANDLMHRDGKAEARWLIRRADLLPEYYLRGRPDGDPDSDAVRDVA